MKVFITGIAGMLGSNIAYLLKENYDISGIDLINVKMDGIQSFNFDMLDFDKLHQCMNDILPDVIIHTAAAVNVDKCECEPSYAHDLNVRLTENICRVAKEISAKVIYISTDAVFDGNNEKLYCETDDVNPINVYGKTKLLGEEIVKKYPNYLILRTNIYGFNIQNKNSFGEWVYKSLFDNQQLNMFDDIDFSPILVNDLAKIIDLSIQNKLSGLYHACATGCISKYDFGCELKKVFGIEKGQIKRTQSDNFEFKAKRAKHMGMDNRKICEKLMILLSTPEESIQKFFQLYVAGYDSTLKKWGKFENENWK